MIYMSHVEIQKIGYAFPGQRCACYSSDLLLRQYKTIREEADGEEDKRFSYRDVKDVYTIVFLEKSGGAFKEYPAKYLHYFEQKSDTGLTLELLQKYIFVPIDIFLKKKDNIDTSNRMNAWLLFLGSDDPGDIIRLIEASPEFKAMYQQIYEMCESVERLCPRGYNLTRGQAVRKFKTNIIIRNYRRSKQKKFCLDLLLWR